MSQSKALPEEHCTWQQSANYTSSTSAEPNLNPDAADTHYIIRKPFVGPVCSFAATPDGRHVCITTGGANDFSRIDRLLKSGNTHQVEFADKQCFTACNEYVDNHHEFFVTTYDKLLRGSNAGVRIHPNVTIFETDILNLNIGLRIYGMTDDDFVVDQVYEFIVNSKDEQYILEKISSQGADKTFYFCTVAPPFSSSLSTYPQKVYLRAWTPNAGIVLNHDFNFTYSAGNWVYKYLVILDITPSLHKMKTYYFSLAMW